MESLIKNIEHYISLNTEEISLLKGAITKKEYIKSEVIFSEGKVANDIYYVSKGCVRLFYNVEGIDRTGFFYTEGQFICAGESYTFNIPAIENYQAMEETEIYILSKTNIDKLLVEIPKMEVIARIATENELITCQKIIASFITKSPEERYLELFKTQKHLFQRVPQQHIASFLGVTPETLSRIKARLIKKARS